MSLLPKVEHPTTHETLPISKKKVQFRPMTVKEEKIIMMVGKSREERILALKQIVENCLITDLDITKIPFADFEFLFLMIRAVSIDNMVTLKTKFKGQEGTTQIDLTKYKIKNLEYASRLTVKLTEKDGIVFRYPSLDDVIRLGESEDFDVVTELIIPCAETFYFGDKVFDRSMPELSDLEIQNFIENQPSKILVQISDTLFKNAPYIYYEITAPDGSIVEVTDFTDFF